MRLNGKVAIVTGAAKRVGRTIALTLASRGAHLMVHYLSSAREAQRVVEQARRMGVRAYPIQADLSQTKESDRIVRETLQHFQRLDILVNSASVYEETRFGKIREQEWDKHLDANLKGTFFLSQSAGRVMVRRKSGKIVNIGDSDTLKPYKHYLPYLVSKSGLDGLTRALAKELAPHVQVNGVSPGPVLLQKSWGPEIKRAILKVTPLKKIGSPQD
ncbi:MAG: SDR family NAD(P)-dependent oxidoreductase, partial [Elusimicrobia bacterium]|nr:SDR family NAD(P)-dependent oxidoreductase [Elusimicrobiota bacterium]